MADTVDQPQDSVAECSDDVPQPQPQPQKRGDKLPRVNCIHCNKLVTKSNLNCHVKRCKARIYDASKQDKDALIEKVNAQQEHISEMGARLRDMQEQFNIEHQLRLESDKKFEKVLSQVCIISRQNISEVHWRLLDPKSCAPCGRPRRLCTMLRNRARAPQKNSSKLLALTCDGAPNAKWGTRSFRHELTCQFISFLFSVFIIWCRNFIFVFRFCVNLWCRKSMLAGQIFTFAGENRQSLKMSARIIKNILNWIHLPGGEFNLKHLIFQNYAI